MRLPSGWTATGTLLTKINWKSESPSKSPWMLNSNLKLVEEELLLKKSEATIVTSRATLSVEQGPPDPQMSSTPPPSPSSAGIWQHGCAESR